MTEITVTVKELIDKEACFAGIEFFRENFGDTHTFDKAYLESEECFFEWGYRWWRWLEDEIYPVFDLEAAVKENPELLKGHDLRHADFRHANLRHADLTGADLTGANLRGANLSGSNSIDTCLRGAYLEDADLSGADLRRSDLTGADLEDANLNGADLSGADLSRVDLIGTDFHYACTCETLIECSICE